MIIHVTWLRHFPGKSCVRAANCSTACIVRMLMLLSHVLYRSRLCITLLMVYVRTGVIHEPSLIADGNIVMGVVDFVFSFLGRSFALLSPSHCINSSQCSPDPPLHSTSLKLLHNNCKFYSTRIRLFPLTQKQTDC